MKIKELKLYSRNIEAQARFYAQILGLTPIEQSAEKLVLAIGTSQLIFEYAADATPYHFAFNIPSNKEVEALEWCKQRVEVLKDGPHEIQDFDTWNAKAVYFYDADKNIVEFIARKNLNNPSNVAFGIAQLLEVSEIGVPTTDVAAVYNQLNTFFDLKIFDGGFERFCAAGDEHGLFICINKTVKDWFPTDDTAYASPFTILTSHENTTHQLYFDGNDIVAIA